MSETDLMRDYIDAFNRRDLDGMTACLSENVAHHISEGGVVYGRVAYRAYLDHMLEHYRDEARDVTLFTGPPGRVAAELVLHGRYLKEDDSGIPAKGQAYRVPVAILAEVDGGLFSRMTIHYNLSDWQRQLRKG
ncbi:MAG: nuclear transport factor 2 family protein [Pseudomonadota bacterium]